MGSCKLSEGLTILYGFSEPMRIYFIDSMVATIRRFMTTSHFSSSWEPRPSLRPAPDSCSASQCHRSTTQAAPSINGRKRARTDGHGCVHSRSTRMCMHMQSHNASFVAESWQCTPRLMKARRCIALSLTLVTKAGAMRVT